MVNISIKGPLVKVGLAQYRIGMAPMRMMTLALGSCLGIVIYDQGSRIGALAHVMHPERNKVKNNSNRAKFVDSAVELMVSRMLRRGAVRDRLEAKIFGGARMFSHVDGSRSIIQIGTANIEAARVELGREGIPIVAECVGGTKGRSIVFDVSDGSVQVKDAYGNKEIL